MFFPSDRPFSFIDNKLKPTWIKIEQYYIYYKKYNALFYASLGYHTNRYCNEHLTIGYDNSPKRRQVEQPKKGEPVAEALVQQRDQVLHSVKILKANDDVESIPVEEVSQERRKSNKLEKHRKKDKGIYSQVIIWKTW